MPSLAGVGGPRRLALALLLLVALGGPRPAAAGPPAAAEKGAPRLAAGGPAAQKGGPPLAWLQYGPAGALYARAIAADGACPTLTLDAAARPMAERAPATADFPLVCEATVPAGTAIAAVDGQPLPLPRTPRRVVVFGDGGCRLASFEVQACDDPAAWPLARVAESAAAWQPDLVIHVGDYVYRFAPCPAGNAGCAGSPWGDNWGGWNADVFRPLAPLLRAAPWVFVRGNHELCDEGGHGWFRFLDPRPWTATCVDYTEPYAVPLGDLQLVVLDSADANDYTAAPEQVAVYRSQLDAVRALATGNAWLLTHRPIWAVGHEGEEAGVEELFYNNPTLQAALGDGSLPGVGLVQSGHLHLFEALSFGSERPPQLVVGTGGTALDPPISTPLAGLEVAGGTVSSGTSVDHWGYLAMEPAGDGWSATLRDPDGGTLAACVLRDRALTCEP